MNEEMNLNNNVQNETPVVNPVVEEKSVDVTTVKPDIVSTPTESVTENNGLPKTNKPEKKNSNILVIVLIVVILGLIGYIVYDKVFAKEEKPIEEPPKNVVDELPEFETDTSLLHSEDRYLVYDFNVGCESKETEGGYPYRTNCSYSETVVIDKAKKCFNYTNGFESTNFYYGKYELTSDSLTLKPLIYASGSDSGYEYINKEIEFAINSNGELEYELTDSEEEYFKSVNVLDKKIMLKKSNLSDVQYISEDEYDKDEANYGLQGYDLCGLGD